MTASANHKATDDLATRQLEHVTGAKMERDLIFDFNAGFPFPPRAHPPSSN
jgi:hypothetical protein